MSKCDNMGPIPSRNDMNHNCHVHFATKRGDIVAKCRRESRFMLIRDKGHKHPGAWEHTLTHTKSALQCRPPMEAEGITGH